MDPNELTTTQTTTEERPGGASDGDLESQPARSGLDLTDKDVHEALAALRKENGHYRQLNRELRDNHTKAELKRKGKHEELLVFERKQNADILGQMETLRTVARDRQAESQARTALASLGVAHDAIGLLANVVVAQASTEWDAESLTLTGDFLEAATAVMEKIGVNKKANGETKAEPAQSTIVATRPSTVSLSEPKSWRVRADDIDKYIPK